MTVLLSPPPRRSGAFAGVCPDCGSILDAPRLSPGSARAARKCLSCASWHDAGAHRPPAPPRRGR